MMTIVAATIALAGCGSSTGTAARTTSTTAHTTSTHPIPAGSASYVGQATNAEILIQWTRDGNSLSGSLQEARRKETGSNEVVSSAAAFTGTVAGNGLTLTLPEGLGTTKALVGTMSGNGFTMTFPAEGHELLSLNFVPGTVADYNHAVNEIEGKAEQGAETSAATSGASPGEPCGTITRPGFNANSITTDGKVDCSEADAVMHDLYIHAGEYHEGPNSAQSYTTINGWICHEGAGGDTCTRSDAQILASEQPG